MHRSEKPDVVKSLNETFMDSNIVIVTRQSGLSVDESSALRKKVREASATFRVSKNTLTRIALKDTPCEGIAEFLSGPTAIAAANDDPVGAAKALVEFAKDNEKLEIVGGSLDGKILSKEDIQALSKLPSLDQLRGTIIGLIQAPATKIAGVTQAPAGQLARVFGAYAATES